MNKLITTFVFIAIFSTTNVYSAGSEDFTPTYVGCFPSGTCYIGISPSATKTTCTKKFQIRFDIKHSGSKMQYSAALSALITGKKIHANLTDNCIDEFPVPDYLHVVK